LSRRAAPGWAPRRTAAGFGNDGTHPNSPPAAPRPDRRGNLHVQVGGDRLIVCAEGSEDDRLWFQRHLGRAHRVRAPIGKERRIKGRYPKGVMALIAVREIRPGARIRLSLGWQGPPPLNSALFARRAFEAAAARAPWVTEFERRIREHMP
jgi:hypothetical protein